MPIKRVCLNPTDRAIYGDEYNVTLELALNDDGTPTRRMTSFGCYGGMGGRHETEPFLLRTDGVLDFGHTFKDNRLSMSNLMSGRAFHLGEYFTIRYDDEDITYRVTQILDPV